MVLSELPIRVAILQTDMRSEYAPQTFGFHLYTSISLLSLPVQGEATATLYKGGTYVNTIDTGVLFNPQNPFGIYCYGNSSISGSWQGIGWHWVAWPGEGIEESLSTYDPSLEMEMSAIQARQSAVLASLGEYSSWNCFNEITSPQVKDVIHDRNAVRLDVVFHTKVIPTYIETGDQMPLLLVSPNGARAVAVFEKANGKILCIPMQRYGIDWTVGTSFVRGLNTVVE